MNPASGQPVNRRGLSVPLLTAFGSDGAFDAGSQQRLVAWVLQQGQGADILFSAGTTGEWNQMSAATLRAVNTAVFEAAAGRAPLWAGVTSLSLADTLENLEHALDLKVQAAVIAPLSIMDAPDPVALFQGPIAALFEKKASALPVFLYDNADIAAHKDRDHLHTKDVKALSRLEFVHGIKVSAGLKVMGNYLKAARHFKTRHEFGLYPGKADVIFSIFKPRHGFFGLLADTYRRFWLRSEWPQGVVAGPANIFPREWQRAWRACAAGEESLMASYDACFRRLSQAWRFEGRSKIVACLKLYLFEKGVLKSDAVAGHTPRLTEEEKALWRLRVGEVEKELNSFVPAGWRSEKG
jgi:dihydrodipicolinate synthase/N-acetylneuraminate lyase